MALRSVLGMVPGVGAASSEISRFEYELALAYTRPIMTTNKKSKPKQVKPLHIEIHGDGIDVVATFQGSAGDSKGRKTKDSGWEKLFQYLANIKMTSSASAVPGSSDGKDLSIEDAVFLIRSATPEDLEIILATIRARAVYDAQDTAAQTVDESAAATSS